MAGLLNQPTEEFLPDLKGLIFRNPQTNQWETDDQYLSGNVREKLVVADAAAVTDPHAACYDKLNYEHRNNRTRMSDAEHQQRSNRIGCLQRDCPTTRPPQSASETPRTSSHPHFRKPKSIGS